MVSFPCRGCKAQLPIDLYLEQSICTYCGEKNEFDPLQMRRVREHVSAMIMLERRISEAAEDSSIQRQQRRLSLHASFVAIGIVVLTMLSPAALGWAFYGEYLQSLLGEFYGKLAGTLVSILWYGGLAVAVFWWRRKMSRHDTQKLWATHKTGQTICNGCGAMVAVWPAQRTECPFCQLNLLPEADTIKKEKERAIAEVTRFETRAEQEVEKTEAQQERDKKKIGKWVRILFGYGCFGGMIVGGIGMLVILPLLGRTMAQKIVTSVNLFLLGSVFPGMGVGWVIETYRERRGASQKSSKGLHQSGERE